jgi:hypothetical protein
MFNVVAGTTSKLQFYRLGHDHVAALMRGLPAAIPLAHAGPCTLPRSLAGLALFPRAYNPDDPVPPHP